jgi:hypothetical protein
VTAARKDVECACGWHLPDIGIVMDKELENKFVVLVIRCPDCGDEFYQKRTLRRINAQPTGLGDQS